MNEETTSGVDRIVLPVAGTIDLGKTDTWLKRQGDQLIVRVLHAVLPPRIFLS